jgi:PAS domain S-box-containing protein
MRLRTTGASSPCCSTFGADCHDDSGETVLASWNVEAQSFLKSILEGVAQPVWVVDHEGFIRFANPAALAALGYDDLSELEGKPSHETIHYKYPDGSPFPVEECPMLLPRQTGETIHSDEDWFFRRDGTMFPVSYWSAPIETPRGRGAVVAFTDIEEHRRAERAMRERDIAEARASEARAAQRRMIEAADAARRQVTRDLHDGAQQQFLNVIINLQLAQQKWASEPDRARELLDAAAKHAKGGIDELRQLAAGIHPPLLTTRGLLAAVEALADELPIPVEPLDIPARRFPPAIEASIYFLISEALTNVVKHARATSAGVRVAAAAGRLTVEVRDDGVGGADLRTPGHGLAGLADRVAALEGTFDVRSEPSMGTTLRAEMPLPS